MEEKSGFLGKVKSLLPFLKKHAALLTLLLVLLLQFVPNGGTYPWGGIWMRMQVSDMPVAESAAQSSVDNFLRQQASATASQQYPNLPDTNKQKVVNELIEKMRSENADKLASEKQKLVNEIKGHYSYEVDGEQYLYMPDIDPYFYLRYARNLEEKGHIEDDVRNGIPWDNHMLAPVGTYADPSWHSYVLALIHKVHSGVPLMEAANYFPVIFIFLSLIFAFLITRKVAGNIGGFFAATMLAVMPAVMGRTPWGHADTDAYNVFFPVLVVWLLFEAFSALSTRKQVIFAALAGVAVGVYSNLWTGWWYLFDFVLGALFVTIVMEILTHLKELKQGVKHLWHHSRIKKFLVVGASMFLAALISISATVGFERFFEGTFKSALGFTIIKDAALPSLWPNVFTTVAELNPASFSDVLASAGGQLMFVIGCIGIVLLLIRRDQHGKFDVTYSALLVLWFIGTIYAATKGLRFTLLLGPAFAVAFGAAVGLLAERLSAFGERQLHVSGVITKALVIIIIGVIIINPAEGGSHIIANSYNSVTHDVPIMNDAWWNALTKIKEVSQPNAIINSWWDFGHHFKFVADRAVTFDGSTQNSPQAHWIGRALQTDDENESVAILRMLDCGANLAYDFAFNATQDPLKAVKLVKKIIMEDKETARKSVKEAGVSDEILVYTHCDAPEDYFIASGDMIGKSGVWSHFGLWSFERAEVWQKWKYLPEEEAVPQMVERFEITKENAEQWHRDANALDTQEAGNTWISPWPGYITADASSCTSVSDNILNCGNIALNASNGRAEIKLPQGTAIAGKVVLYNKDGTKQVRNDSQGNVNLGVVIWPTSVGTSALAAYSQVADSLFTRLYYMEGLGLEHFRILTKERQLLGGNVNVYKVDWAGSAPYIPENFAPKTKVEQNAQVKLNYIGWTDDGVFDSSIVGWKEKNVTSESSFDALETSPLAFVSGQGKLIPGFENGIQGMKSGETKILTIPPEQAYGTDPSKHPLGNKTLRFKIRVESVQ